MVRLRVRLRQYIADHKVEICIIVLVPLAFALGVWRFGWGWTGFCQYTTQTITTTDTIVEIHPGKTLWDWMELLIIPLVLAGGGLLLNRAQRQRELDIAKNREEERALQSYLEAMTELLLEKKLRTPEEGSEVRSIAHARTLTILRSLSSERRGSILRFLYEAKLIDREKTVINLVEAYLVEASLWRANLKGANLEGACLMIAKLSGANLEEANLEGAFLCEANLERACLIGANLRGADLLMANLQGANLKNANLERTFLLRTNLQGAILSQASLRRAHFTKFTILPDGTKWTPDTDVARFTDPEHPDFWQPDA